MGDAEQHSTNRDLRHRTRAPQEETQLREPQGRCCIVTNRGMRLSIDYAHKMHMLYLPMDSILRVHYFVYAHIIKLEKKSLKFTTLLASSISGKEWSPCAWFLTWQIVDTLHGDTHVLLILLIN